MIALIKKFLLSKIASVLGTKNTKQLEQVVEEKKKPARKKKTTVKSEN